MSLRSSRRSGAAGSAGGLNPATISFLDRSRLIKELTERNLPINGTRGALADRLYDFVVNGTVPPEQSTPTTSTKKEKEKEEVVEPPTEEIVEEKPEEPVPIKTPTPKKGRKPRKSQAEKVTETVVSVKVEEEVVETVISPKKRRSSGRKQAAPPAEVEKVTTVVKIEQETVTSFDLMTSGPLIPAEPSPKKKAKKAKEVKKETVEQIERVEQSDNGVIEIDDEQPDLSRLSRRSRGQKRERYSPVNIKRSRRNVVEISLADSMEVPPDEEEPMEDEPQEPVKEDHDSDYEAPEKEKEREARLQAAENGAPDAKRKKMEDSKSIDPTEKRKESKSKKVEDPTPEEGRPKRNRHESATERPTSLSISIPDVFDNDSGSNSSASATPTIKKKAVSTLAKPPSKPKLPPPPQMITTKHKWSAMMAEYKREKQMTEEATTSSPKTRISEPSTSSATQPPVKKPSNASTPASNVGKTVLDEIIGDKPVVLTKPDWRKTTKPAPKKEQNADVLGQIFTAQEQSLKQRRLDEERRNPPRTEPDLKPLRSADTTPRPQNPEKVYSETSLLPPPPPPPRIKGNASPPPPPPPKDLQMAPAPPVGVKRRSRFDQPPPEVVAQQTYMMHMAHMGMGPPPFPMMPPPPWMMGMPPPVGAPPFVAPPAALPAPRPVAALPPPPPTPNSKPNSASNSSSNTPIMKPSPVIAQSPVTSRSPPPPPPPPKRSNISGTPTAVFEAKAEKSPPPPPPPRPPKVEKEEEPVVLPPPPPFPKPRAEEPPAAVLRDWLPLEARSASNRAPTEEETREKDKFKSFLENLHNSVFHEDPASNEEEEAEDKEDEINGQVESERLEGGREPLPTTSEQPTDAEDVKDEDEEEEFVIRDTTVDVENGTQEETRQVVTEVAPSCEEKSTAVVPTSAAEEPIVEYDPLENTSCCETDFYVYEPSFRKGEGEEIVMDVEHEEDVYNEEEQEYEEGHEVQKEEEEEEPAEEPMEEEPEIDLTDANARRDLLMRAMPLLQSFNVVEKEKEVPEEEAPQDLYCQLSQNNEEFERTKEDTEVYYHGEPVPDDDDMNLFEIAAGIKPKKKEKKPLVTIIDEEPPPSLEAVELDYYNADIHVKSAEKKVWLVEPYTSDGLALMWGGVRTNFGVQLPFVNEGPEAKTKIGFQVRIDSYQSVLHLPTEFTDEGDARVGFSLDSAPLVLGEYAGSWGVSASGKKAHNNVFVNFDLTFDIGDIITTIIDLKEGRITYLKNNEPVGTAFSEINLEKEAIIYPHVCVKNCNLHVNLGDSPENEELGWNVPEDRDWMFLTEVSREKLVRTRIPPESKSACTVLMMVGLPGVGKTTWVRRYLADHPHEFWDVINADKVMDAMRVNGVARNRIPTLKRLDFLRGMIGKSMARLVQLAPRRRKNYLLDMTNCILEKRKRKLMAFEEFNRKCVVFVPDDDVHRQRLRQQEQEENEKLDTDALMQHKAAMSIPTQETDPCEEVLFIDPPPPYEYLAYERVQRMNTECRAWLMDGNRRRGGMYSTMGLGLPPFQPPQHTNFNNASVLLPNTGMNVTTTVFPAGAPPGEKKAEENFLMSIKEASKETFAAEKSRNRSGTNTMSPTISPIVAALPITKVMPAGSFNTISLGSAGSSTEQPSSSRSSIDFKQTPDTRVPALGVTIPKTTTSSATPSPLTPRTAAGQLVINTRVPPPVLPSPVVSQQPISSFSPAPTVVPQYNASQPPPNFPQINVPPPGYPPQVRPNAYGVPIQTIHSPGTPVMQMQQQPNFVVHQQHFQQPTNVPLSPLVIGQPRTAYPGMPYVQPQQPSPMTPVPNMNVMRPGQWDSTTPPPPGVAMPTAPYMIQQQPQQMPPQMPQQMPPPNQNPWGYMNHPPPRF